jgi:hypothetical protein
MSIGFQGTSITTFVAFGHYASRHFRVVMTSFAVWYSDDA